MARIKTPVLSAVAFFWTLGILSVGYSAYVSNYPATATAGTSQLSAGEWNKMVTALQALDGKLSTFTITAGGNVGIWPAAPSVPLEVGNGTTVRWYVKLNNDSVNSPVLQLANGITWGRTYNLYSGFYANTGSLVFADLTAGNVARMTLDGNGNVGIWTTAPAWHLEVSNSVANGYVGISNSNNAAGGIRWTWLNGSTGSPLGAGKMCFESGGACRLAIDSSGNATAATFNGVSDSRLKTNVETVSGLNAVEKLRWVEFDWKNGTGKSSGVIAQELETVLPHLVATDSSPEKMRSVNYAGLSAYFIEAIKELKKRNDALETKNAELEKRLGALEASK